MSCLPTRPIGDDCIELVPHDGLPTLAPHAGKRTHLPRPTRLTALVVFGSGFYFYPNYMVWLGKKNRGST